jgi:hypothetical protein
MDFYQSVRNRFFNISYLNILAIASCSGEYYLLAGGVNTFLGSGGVDVMFPFSST